MPVIRRSLIASLLAALLYWVWGSLSLHGVLWAWDLPLWLLWQASLVIPISMATTWIARRGPLPWRSLAGAAAWLLLPILGIAALRVYGRWWNPIVSWDGTWPLATAAVLFALLLEAGAARRRSRSPG